MINYLAVDSEVFTKTLTVRDSGSRRLESFSKSGRLEEPEVETDSAEETGHHPVDLPEPRRTVAEDDP